MEDIAIAVTAASYSGNKGAAAMLQSSIKQLKEAYGDRLEIYLMSVYPEEDRVQCPHDFVKIIPAQPQRVLFLAFPCAVLYRMFRWCPPLKYLLSKNQILKTYQSVRLVVDEAGISFADSRGIVMNFYAFACMAVPLLMGRPVVKYSQAMGPFHKVTNRMLAKWILPKLELVIARGRATYENLVTILPEGAAVRPPAEPVPGSSVGPSGLSVRPSTGSSAEPVPGSSVGLTSCPPVGNIRFCADGAFTMPRDLAIEKRVAEAWEKAGSAHTVGLSISSVVDRKCKKAGIGHREAMVAFIKYLVGEGYQVYMFANAARIHSQKSRNNDLMVGDAIYQAYQEQAEGAGGLRWEHREMDAEEIRASIGHCELLVASRFHAMVFALTEQVPVMLVGWSHKYQEVLEQFGLGEYATDYSCLSLPALQESFEKLVEHKEEIKGKLRDHLPAVQESSRKNVQYIINAIDRIPVQEGHLMGHVIDLSRPERYLGPFLACKMGYAADPDIRANAASGGMVTALLCDLLENHVIDGAWVVKTVFDADGALSYETFIATTVQQVREASSSVYMDIPMLSHLSQLRQFAGKLAVVLTPCMMRAFKHMLEKEEALRNKIVLKIGLFCSGAHEVQATEYALRKCRIPRAGAKRLYYRRGHWRGKSSVLYEDGSQRDFSYKKTICAYKNAYFFIKPACLHCRDQFAAAADISFGDVWLPEMKNKKKEPIKHTGCVIRTEEAYALLRQAESRGSICMRHMSAAQMLRSQKRALTFKYRSGRLNHKLAGYLAEKNRAFSQKHPQLLWHIPMPVIYYYMCFIRFLLSW